MKGCCYIAGAGSVYENDLPFSLNSHDFLIAADGGYSHLQRAGMEPHLLIGDFDSMEKPAVSCETITLPVEKDDTDLAFAVKEGLRRGYTRFVIYGGLGGDRLSHTLANIQLLEYISNQKATAVLKGGTTSLFLLCEGQSHDFVEETGKTFSLFSVTQTAVVSQQGVKYPLTQATLERSFPLGVSNRVTEEKATVTVHQGKILVITEKEA